MGKSYDRVGSNKKPLGNALKRDAVNIIPQLDDVAHYFAFEVVKLTFAGLHMIVKRFLVLHKRLSSSRVAVHMVPLCVVR